MDCSAWTNEITIENPCVSAADEWGDFRGWDGRDTTGAGVLPPVRRKVQHEDDSATSRREGGFSLELRIDPKLRKQTVGASDGSEFEVVLFNQEIIKLDIDEPPPPKVQRVKKFHPLPVLSRNEILERQLDREVSQDWGKSTGRPAKGILFFSIGVVATVVLAMILLPMMQPKETVRNRVVYAAVNEPSLPEDSLGQIDMLKRAGEATGLFRRFASAVTHDDLLATVRHHEEIAPLVKRNTLRPMLPPRWEFTQSCGWESYSEKGRVCGVLSGVLPDFSPFTAFMTMEHGVLLLDWKATTGFGTASFSELERGDCDASEIRGFLKPSDFYTAAFSEQEYRSYVLLSPNREASVWVYTKRDGVAEARLASAFSGGEIVPPDTEALRFTVALARPKDENCPANQWIVKEVLHKQWIRP